MNNSPIFITGIPRSGISMTAGIVDLHNTFGGDIDYRYSNKEIVRDILNPYFLLLGDTYCHVNVPSPDSIFPILNLRDKILSIVEEQGYYGGRWYIKDSRLILIHSILDEAFPEADWVVVKRDKKDIANSCQKTSYMNKNNSKDDWLEWIDKWVAIYTDIESKNFNFHEVYPSNFINGNFDEINNILEKLELK